MRALALRLSRSSLTLRITQDGDLDLYVTNTWASNNLLYQNDGSCVFTDVASSAGVDVSCSSNGGIWGDYDADGDVDLFVVNAASDSNGGPNMLFQNQVCWDGVQEGIMVLSFAKHSITGRWDVRQRDGIGGRR